MNNGVKDDETKLELGTISLEDMLSRLKEIVNDDIAEQIFINTKQFMRKEYGKDY